MRASHLISVGLVLLASAAPLQALACGGCFVPSGSSSPTVQESERVLFVRDPKTGVATVWVEIRYNGPANDFGWVVPVPALPKVGVGARYVFDRLDLGAEPVFQTVPAPPENCGANSAAAASSGGGGCGGGGFGGGFSLFASDDGSEDLRGDSRNRRLGVQVLEQDQVGPYEYSIVSGTTADGLYQWLNARHYQIPDKAKPILDSHLAKGDLFVAVRLKSGASAQQIQPISLTMPETSPCVPLRLTSIAAVEDLNVRVYTVDAARAVPKNHLHVVVNPVRVQWFDGASNYEQVVSAAIDEAGGRAFVTEYAGSLPAAVDVPVRYWMTGSSWIASETASEPLLQSAEVNTAQLAKAKTSVEAFDALREMKLVLDDETVPILEEALLVTEWYGWYYAKGLVGNYNLWRDGQFPIDEFEVDGAAAARLIEHRYLKPIRQMKLLLAKQPYLTRLVLRISPDEMTRDPLFAFQPGLPDVDRFHRAQIAPVCKSGSTPVDAYRLFLPELNRSWVFPRDLTSVGPLANNAADPRFTSAPAALRIELLDETQQTAKPIAPKSVDLVDSAIAGAKPGEPTLPAGLVVPDGPSGWTPPASDPPVTTKEKASGFGWPLLLLLAAVGWQRRRRTVG